MMISEFNTLTGFYPSWSLWLTICRTYNESGLDKNEWCRQYVKNADGIAGRIARLTDELDEDHGRSWCIQVEEARAEIKMLKEQLKKAKAQLEDAQGWQPAKDLGTNMNQDAYAELADDSAPMSELDAIRRVYEMCGFDMALIRIVKTVNTYEVNKQHRCRVSGEYERPPVWSSTDWNYIRFNVADLQWELVDGELHAYYT